MGTDRVHSRRAVATDSPLESGTLLLHAQSIHQTPNMEYGQAFPTESQELLVSVLAVQKSRCRSHVNQWWCRVPIKLYEH